MADRLCMGLPWHSIVWPCYVVQAMHSVYKPGKNLHVCLASATLKQTHPKLQNWIAVVEIQDWIIVVPYFHRLRGDTCIATSIPKISAAMCCAFEKSSHLSIRVEWDINNNSNTSLSFVAPEFLAHPKAELAKAASWSNDMKSLNDSTNAKC